MDLPFHAYITLKMAKSWKKSNRTLWSVVNKTNAGVKVVHPCDHALWMQCERLEYDVFSGAGYVSTSKESRIDFFDSYKKMEFIAVFDEGRSSCTSGAAFSGVLRIVYPPEERRMQKQWFPTLCHARRLDYTSTEFRHDESLRLPKGDNRSVYLFADAYDRIMRLDPRKCIDLSTISIASNCRGGNVSAKLITRTMTRTWETPPARYGFLVVDSGYCRKNQSRNIPLEDLGPPVMYWGSHSIPVIIDSYTLLKGFHKLFLLFYRAKGYVGLRE